MQNPYRTLLQWNRASDIPATHSAPGRNAYGTGDISPVPSPAASLSLRVSRSYGSSYLFYFCKKTIFYCFDVLEHVVMIENVKQQRK